MNLNLEETASALNSIVGLSLQERLSQSKLWEEYWNLLARSRHKNEGLSDNSFPQNTIGFLASEGVISPHSSVIEIGAGSGSYTLPLAACCHEVLAVDSSWEMLGVLSDVCKAKGFTNIQACDSRFETLTTEKQYDLAFAALCPAISDTESLLRFESLSKEWCAVVTVAKGSRSLVRSQLRPLLSSKPLHGLSPDVIYQYNYLYALGRSPSLRQKSYCTESTLPLEDAIDRYKLYYSIFGLSTPAHHSIIESYFKDRAVNGLCHDQTTYCMAVMWWHKP